MVPQGLNRSRMKKLIILGTGGNCLDIYDAALAINRQASQPVYDCLGLLDDNRELHGKEISGLRVLGGLADAAKYPDAVFVNGIGSPTSFWRKADILRGTGLRLERFETIVHPQASVSSLARLGRGVAILPGASVAACAEIGNHVILLQGSIISHHCRIGDYGCVASGACLSGNVEVAEFCYIGANVSVRNSVKIGPRSLVGIGAVVLQDVVENTVVVGNPAKYLRHTVR
jgi:sugar O-acyltransferase (sialic acid O-acetyltransferase NeuD family)